MQRTGYSLGAAADAGLAGVAPVVGEAAVVAEVAVSSEVFVLSSLQARRVTNKRKDNSNDDDVFLVRVFWELIT